MSTRRENEQLFLFDSWVIVTREFGTCEEQDTCWRITFLFAERVGDGHVCVLFIFSYGIWK